MTTPEQLRMIANRLLGIANRLEAAPKEKPEFRPIPTKYEVAWEELQERLYRGVDCEAIEIMDEVSKRWLTPAESQQSKEQPPIDQNEPKSGVWIDGEWREIVLSGDCPGCGDYHDRQAEHPSEQHGCQWRLYEAIVPRHPTKIAQRFWLAPPAVIEPEPELDEFEQWLEDEAMDALWNTDYGSVVALDTLKKKYREIVTRKGDK